LATLKPSPTDLSSPSPSIIPKELGFFR
jgi:hypothetical protein